MSDLHQLAEFNIVDVFEGVPPSDTDLPRPHTVDLESRAFLSAVARSALQETQGEQEARVSGEPSGAACAIASTKVSLSESEDETPATLETITESLGTPDWVGSAQVAALTHTLTALSLAGVLVTSTSVE